MTLPLPKNRLKLSLTIPALMLLVACTMAASSSCGTLFTYSRDFERQAAAELDALKAAGTSPHLVQMMDDYHKTRDTIRACQ